MSLSLSLSLCSGVCLSLLLGSSPEIKTQRRNAQRRRKEAVFQPPLPSFLPFFLSFFLSSSVIQPPPPRPGRRSAGAGAAEAGLARVRSAAQRSPEGEKERKRKGRERRGGGGGEGGHKSSNGQKFSLLFLACFAYALPRLASPSRCELRLLHCIRLLAVLCCAGAASGGIKRSRRRGEGKKN